MFLLLTVSTAAPVVTMDAHEAYTELIRRVRELRRPRLVFLSAGMGRADVHAPRGAAIALPRWACWPACTMSAQPTPGSATYLRSSKIRIWSPSRDHPRGQRPRVAAKLRSPRPVAARPGRGTGSHHLPRAARVGRGPLGERFRRFRPWLEKIVQLKRQESACLSRQSRPMTPQSRHPVVPRQAPSHCRSPRATRLRSPARRVRARGDNAELAVVFQAPARACAPWSRQSPRPAGVVSHGPTRMLAIGNPAASVGQAILSRFYPRERQKIFGEVAAAAVGFDFQRGRLDVTAHPFCSGIGPGDCRITTRYDEHNFSDAFFGILHEAGHGLYEQGLDPDHYGTPMGEAVSLGIHESQSRLWENAVARSRPFWNYWFPIARRIFREALADVTVDAFHAAVNYVTPSLIRVQADEVTYNLHIIVRFELEQALLSGDLAVADLPAAWNQKYARGPGPDTSQRRRRLSPGHSLECRADRLLSDLHAGQSLCGPALRPGTVRRRRVRSSLRAGDYSGLLAWLHANVHREGQRHRSAELIEHITGSKPDHRPLIDGPPQKYSELYGI